MSSNLWRHPCKWWQYPLFGLGWLLFWVIVIPLMWFFKLIGKPMDLWIALHIQAICYNPWELLDS